MSRLAIPQDEIEFSKTSLVDNFGRVFFWKGRIFRAIHQDRKERCLHLLDSELFASLRKLEYVVNTWVTNYDLNGFALVLEHELLVVSNPHHWSFSMYKDAALLTLKINNVCRTHGFQLKDAHPYNVLFKNNNPVWVDIGSIEECVTSDKWPAYQEFIQFFYLQLLVWSRGDFYFARKLIEDGVYPMLRTIPMSRPLDSLAINSVGRELFDYKLQIKGKTLISHHRKFSTISATARILNSIFKLLVGKSFGFKYSRRLKDQTYVFKRIESLSRPVKSSTWGTYHDSYKTNGRTIPSDRFLRIVQILKELDIEFSTILDLAGNQGAFTDLLQSSFQLSRILLSDYDENAIDRVYLELKGRDSLVQLYLFNFMLPVKVEDLGDLRADIVFALAITHHLTLTQHYSLFSVFSRISQLTNRFAVVEFMPLGLWDGNNGTSIDVPGWYTLEFFRDEFLKHFIVLHEEKVEANRIVFVGKKRFEN